MRALAVAGIAAVAIAVIAALRWRGPWWSMVAVAVAVGALLGCRLALRVREVPAAAVAVPEHAESLARWNRRAETTIGWSGGTRADWDRHLRPMLARELRKDTTHGTDAETGLRLFGSDLWPWVDPYALTSTADAERPGPGREVFGRILDRLDSL